MFSKFLVHTSVQNKHLLTRVQWTFLNHSFFKVNFTFTVQTTILTRYRKFPSPQEFTSCFLLLNHPPEANTFDFLSQKLIYIQMKSYIRHSFVVGIFNIMLVIFINVIMCTISSFLLLSNTPLY